MVLPSQKAASGAGKETAVILKPLPDRTARVNGKGRTPEACAPHQGRKGTELGFVLDSPDWGRGGKPWCGEGPRIRPQPEPEGSDQPRDLGERRGAPAGAARGTTRQGPEKPCGWMGQRTRARCKWGCNAREQQPTLK